MSEIKRPADWQARQQALDPTQSFAVTAPAGSGKTGLLTQRVLTLLAKVKRPEEILCITFTRKAAAEMHSRILNAIRRAQTESEPANEYDRQTWLLAKQVLAQDTQYDWQLLVNPNRLRIQTIDSLCAYLVRHFPLQTGFGGMPDILDDASECYQQAVRKFLGLLRQSSPETDLLSKLLLHLDNDLNKLSLLLEALLSRRDQWLPYVVMADTKQLLQYIEQGLVAVITDNLTVAASAISYHGSELAQLADFAGQQLAEEKPDHPLNQCVGLTGLPNTTPDALPQWLALVELLITKDGSWRKSVTKTIGFPTGKTKAEKPYFKEMKQRLLGLIDALATQPGLAQQLANLRLLPPVHYQPKQGELLIALCQLLPLLVAQLMVTFTEQGKVDHTDINRAALAALGSEDAPTDLALVLDYRINHILVDEFQDTSKPQLTLLEKLTAGWQTGDGRSLFIVGDGMQSCYGFRDANVGIFLNARQHGIGSVALTPLSLTVNFRSQAKVIDWVNNTFQQSFPQQENIPLGAVSYAQSTAFNSALAGTAVECIGFHDEAGRQLEAAKTVDVVSQYLAASATDTIAILVRSRGHLRDIIAALQAAGIKWQATEIDPLASRAVIQDLLSLTRALLNSADKLAWLATLRAPWCGLSNDDLEVLAQTQGVTTVLSRLQDETVLAKLSRHGQQRLATVVPILQQVANQRQRKPFAQVLAGCWQQIGGEASLDHEQSRQEAEVFFATLCEYATSFAGLDLAAFENKLNRLYAQPDPDANPRVQIMTIHKAKGLEFDVVILPGLDKQPRADDKPLLVWQQFLSTTGDDHLLLSPVHAYEAQSDAIYDFIRHQQQQKQRLENTRLLYVAATRAIKKLYLLFNGKQQETSGEVKAPVASSLLATIWPAIKDQVSWQMAPTPLPSQSTAPGIDLSTGWRLPSHYQPPTQPYEQLLKAYRGEEFNDEENLPEMVWDEVPRHVGTVVHRALYHITLLGIEQIASQPQQYCQQRYTIWRNQLRQLGIAQDELTSACHQVKHAIENTLADPKAQWFLNHQHPASQCEYPLTLQMRDKTIHYVVDRTFIDPDTNIRWIIDYKTVQLAQAAAESIDHKIAAEVQQYRAQLKGYVQTFQVLGNEPIRAALYFTDIQHLAEVDC
ncbi:UvrD-helicase domain-containing protein [Endozoicomonas sp. SM1973]|uniref:DNA 3'-5' helicase n=1 Tax=Spartinivicinus marinus TaxID=2994442 RepID=A0A853ICQ1_9GAMM|nr:UvrD-helicase domain-containing protein [Spartinivicinus marinus]MCX4029581.1 UvrD-helicase domain-containing protein [Spartinivicinus marinus]NYZ65156.1 UvrD-helicase domain-containing protein [Spartinivicinus marinus]